jgi:hypothetical protein
MKEDGVSTTYFGAYTGNVTVIEGTVVWVLLGALLQYQL